MTTIDAAGTSRTDTSTTTSSTSSTHSAPGQVEPGQTYTVQPGDSLLTISARAARAAHDTVQQTTKDSGGNGTAVLAWMANISSANPGVDLAHLKPGTELKIPTQLPGKDRASTGDAGRAEEQSWTRRPDAQSAAETRAATTGNAQSQHNQWRIQQWQPSGTGSR